MALMYTQSVIGGALSIKLDNMKLSDIEIDVTPAEETQDTLDILEILKEENINGALDEVKQFNQVISVAIDRNAEKMHLEDLNLTVLERESTDGIK